MTKVMDCKESIIVFLYDDLENNSKSYQHITFDFSFSHTIKYFGGTSELFEDGEGLQNFKEKFKKFNDETIKKALVKAMDANEIKYYSKGHIEFKSFQLTEQGYKKANSIKLNKIENKKQIWKYSLEKIFMPVIIPVISAVIISYIVTELQIKNFNKEVENLKKEIEWIKLNK